MIVVDSSVWIDVLRDRKTPEVDRFFEIEDLGGIVVGDIIMLEVLRGAQNDRHSENIRKRLEKFSLVAMLTPELAVEAARHYRLLRGHGIIVRKTADLIIGTYCIKHQHKVLQADRDFLPMAEHLGLKLA